MSYKKMTIEQIDVNGKRVFLRADLNVPMDDQQNVTNDRRIRASLPTIQYLLERGASVVLASHLGRPKGGPNPKYSLKPIAKRLSELLGKEVKMAPDSIGPEVEAMAKALKPGEVLLLENVRFHPEEEKNNPEYSKALASLADVYVSDAFGTVHRAHSSTEGVAHLLKPAVAGFLIAKELKYLGGALANPERPLVAILGGAKVGSKIAVITNLLKICDTIVIGGGMAYTFYKIQGKEIGESLFDAESAEIARQILEDAEKSGKKFLLPVDCVIADKFDNNAATQVVATDAIPAGWMGMDIGPKTIEMITNEVKNAKTVVWNGPLGVFEMENFSKGTVAVAKALAASNAVTILGGGETAQAAEEFGLDGQMSLVSTGGGASLEFMEGKVLPGIAALDDAK